MSTPYPVHRFWHCATSGAVLATIGPIADLPHSSPGAASWNEISQNEYHAIREGVPYWH